MDLIKIIVFSALVFLGGALVYFGVQTLRNCFRPLGKGVSRANLSRVLVPKGLIFICIGLYVLLDGVTRLKGVLSVI